MVLPTVLGAIVRGGYPGVPAPGPGVRVVYGNAGSKDLAATATAAQSQSHPGGSRAGSDRHAVKVRDRLGAHP